MTTQKLSPSHGTDTLHCIANHMKSLQLNNIHQTSPHAKTKTSACFVHYSGKTFQTLMRRPTNANVVKCRMKKFSSQTFQSSFHIHPMDHKMNTVISTYGVTRPTHLNSKCAWHLTNHLQVLHKQYLNSLTSELVSSGTSTSIAHHSHMLQAKECPEDHSNSSTSPSYGQEAHADLGIVENWHRQSIKYWRHSSQQHHFLSTQLNQESRKMS